MTPTPPVSAVVVGKFDPARVFPPDDPLTLPLLRLMLATDDVRHASMLFVMADYQVRTTTGIQQTLHGGQMWYLFRLLCSHLKEGGNALNTLVNSVATNRLKDLLKGPPGRRGCSGSPAVGLRLGYLHHEGPGFDRLPPVG
jgi:hypothetical protein